MGPVGMATKVLMRRIIAIHRLSTRRARFPKGIAGADSAVRSPRNNVAALTFCSLLSYKLSQHHTVSVHTEIVWLDGHVPSFGKSNSSDSAVAVL